MTKNATGRPTPKKSGYLPTLDGWRALAILAVIFHHGSVYSLGIFNTRWLYEYGAFGVDVFFAISGLLISSRLLDEEQISGSIHLKRFYIRRFFRIVPPAFLYLLVVALLAKGSVISVSKHEWFEALLFCRNYVTIFGAAVSGESGWYTGHFWSLSLEEQFYLILPAILVLSAKRYRAAMLTAFIFLIAVHRFFILHLRPWRYIEFHADVRLDALLVPALFAVLISNVEIRALFKHLLRFWPLLALATFCLIPFGKNQAWHISLLIVLMPCIVLGSVLNPDNFGGKVLEWTWLRYIGRISYSLYLWQQLFFTQHFVLSEPIGLWQTWPLNLILTFGCAIASYYLLERPLARLGHRWAPSATPGREDLDVGHTEQVNKQLDLHAQQK